MHLPQDKPEQYGFFITLLFYFIGHLSLEQGAFVVAILSGITSMVLGWLRFLRERKK